MILSKRSLFINSQPSSTILETFAITIKDLLPGNFTFSTSFSFSWRLFRPPAWNWRYDTITRTTYEHPICPQGDVWFSQAGDSGSLVFTKSHVDVSMLFAGGTSHMMCLLAICLKTIRRSPMPPMCGWRWIALTRLLHKYCYTIHPHKCRLTLPKGNKIITMTRKCLETRCLVLAQVRIDSYYLL